MQVILYKTNSDPRKVDKYLYGGDGNNGMSIDCVIKGECSITHPQLLFSRENRGWYSDYNYCFIPDFNRYYYIDNITFMPGNYAVFDTSIDVLMSHKNAIRNLTVMIERQENIYNPYIIDDGIVITQGSYKKVIDVGAVTSDSTKIYLTAIGAVQEEVE